MPTPIILAPSGRPAAAELAVGESIMTQRARVNAVDPYGTPNFDPNFVVTQLERRGSAARPGIYDEMICYPAIARAVQAVEEAAVSTEWELRWPNGFIPTPADDEFMTLCRRWIVERPVVLPGMDVDGLDNLIPYMLAQEWYGFGLFIPSFTTPDPETADLQWFPTRSSAVTKWNPDFTTGGYASALFSTSTGSTVLNADQFVHVGRRVMPGEMEGVSRLRPLIVPFENVKQLLLDAGIYDTMRNGWLDVAYEPGSEGPADQARMLQGVAMVQAGATRAVLHKATEKWSMQFPAGTPPDVVGRVELYERQMRELLDQSLGSVGDKGGSLALGRAAQEVDEARQTRWIARAVNQSARAMMLWIARQLGCDSILRTVPNLSPVATESSASLEQVQQFMAAQQAGIVRAQPQDQAWVRAAVGAPVPPPVKDEPAADAPQPLAVGSLQAAVTILTTPGMAPEAMRILLEGTGLDPAKAEAAMRAQAAMAKPAPVQPPVATASAVPQGVSTGALQPTAPGSDVPPRAVKRGAADVDGEDYEVATLSAAETDAHLAELAGDVPDYQVPPDVQDACRRALEALAALPTNRRSTDTAAIQTARDLSRGVRIRWSRVLAMLGWMERDAVRAKRGGANLEGDDSRVAQAYRLRGGAAAVRWLRQVYRDHAAGMHVRAAQLAADDVDTEPTDGMVEEAKRGLAWREEYGRGGTEVGVARARDIANRRNLSPETVKRMVSFFARHKVDKQGAGWDRGSDGYPSAGRIAWALWGGDAGAAWAEKVAGQLDRRAELAAPSDVPVGEDREVEDADGETFILYRPLRPEEKVVAWVQLASDRDSADEAMVREVGEIAEEQRRETWAASADGWQPGEAEAIRAKYTARYEAVVRRYTRGLAGAARTAAADEARRAIAQAGGFGELDAVTKAEARTAIEATDALAARKAAAADQLVPVSAQTMAQRVEGELAQAVIAGATPETFETKISDDGLAQQAKVAGTQAESAARLETYANPPKPKGGGGRLVPYSVIRTSIPDRNRCRHCREMDTGKPIIVADTEVSDGVYAIPELPDPECEGAPNCRCGYVVQYKRVD